MKHAITVALFVASAGAYAYTPMQGAEVLGVHQYESRGSDTVLQQNEQNDPSIHGRRTQSAYELGGVGQEEHRGPVIETAPVDTYPEHIGDAVIDEGYPAK